LLRLLAFFKLAVLGRRTFMFYFALFVFPFNFPDFDYSYGNNQTHNSAKNGAGADIKDPMSIGAEKVT
jgi:hypothetical protein